MWWSLYDNRYKDKAYPDVKYAKQDTPINIYYRSTVVTNCPEHIGAEASRFRKPDHNKWKTHCCDMVTQNTLKQYGDCIHNKQELGVVVLDIGCVGLERYISSLRISV